MSSPRGPIELTNGRGAVLVGGARLPRWRRARLARAVDLPAWWRLRAAQSRYGYTHDVAGPKVRLGALWFAAELGALWLGPWAIAVLLAPVAAVAATQTASALRRNGEPAARAVAGPAAGAFVAAGAVSARAAGLVLLAALAVSLGRPSNAARRPGNGMWAARLVGAGADVRSWLFGSLGAVAVVLLARAEPVAATVLVATVGAFDAGDFLVGSGATNWVEGPLAGMIGALVVTFSVAVIGPSGLTATEAWFFGLAAVVLCPLGPLAASAALPRAASFAPALRRLDSLMIVGLAWLVAWR